MEISKKQDTGAQLKGVPKAEPGDRTQLESPDLETLMSWMVDDGGCEAACPHGCWVEPDGQCEHDNPSWLIVLGLI